MGEGGEDEGGWGWAVWVRKRVGVMGEGEGWV